VNWIHSRRSDRTPERSEPLVAPAEGLAQLEAARARQLRWTGEFAAAGDLAAAMDAFLDADAIDGELIVSSGP
jgi:hypothetical protein